MAALQQFAPGATVNLSMLIDMVLQKTYHELTLLSELLPRKSDIERKIDIIQFATNTRQQFIRLLALVKWASNADKVDQCQEVSATLDQTNMFFINTADTLAKMARETLVNARLPSFSLPTAVDVLTTGTFNRLPLCIKEKIVPADPISISDRKRTLKRLNEIVQNRLAASKIPPHFTSVTISEGRVKLTVQDEFQVTLTLMSDQPNIPWRLLSIEFLIKDFETGDGKPLVHKMQIHYIHQLLQSRLMGDGGPLAEIYDCLHYFSMSLQLEVLHTQAVRLINEKWGDLVKVDEYVAGQKLAISYWRTPQNSQNPGQAPSILIKSLGSEPSSLLLYHQPEVNNEEDIFSKSAATELLPSCVAMENILTLAVHERSKSKLRDLIKTLQKDKYFTNFAEFDEGSISIKIRPFENCTESDMVFIKIDSRSGRMMIDVDEKIRDYVKKNDFLRLLEDDVKEFKASFHNLRCHIFLAKCSSLVALLPVRPCFYLPITNNVMLQKLSRNRLYLRFYKHPCHALVISVDVDTDDENHCLRDKYFILSMSLSNHLSQRKRDNSTTEEAEQKAKTQVLHSQQCLFYNPESLMQLNKDAFLSSSNSGMVLEVESNKRKGVTETVQSKRQKVANNSAKSSKSSCSCKTQIASMVTACDLRIPFIRIPQELSRAGVSYQIVNSDADSALFVRILQLPDVANVNKTVIRKLRKLLILCTIQLDESMFFWEVEYKFSKSLFNRVSAKDRGKYYIGTKLKYERTDSNLRGPAENDSLWNKMMQDWRAINFMFEHALVVRDYLEDESGDLYNLIAVESFDFQTLSLAYGEKYNYKISITWNSSTEEFNLGFGITGKEPDVNPHQLVSRELQRELNNHRHLPYMLQIIVKTAAPLRAMCNIPTYPTLGTTTRPLLPLQNMSIVTQTSTHLRLFYKNAYVVDLNFIDEGVLIRDGHFTKSDPAKQLGGIGPAENFMVFLQRFADKTEQSSNVFDLDKSQRDGYQKMHGVNDSPGHTFSSSMQSPAFSSPTSHVTGGTTSTGTYSGQMTSMSPVNRYSGSSPGFIQPSPTPAQSTSMTSPASWPHSPQVPQGSPLHTKSGVVPGNVGGSDQAASSRSAANSVSVIFMSTSAFARLITPVEQEFPSRKTKYYASSLNRFFDALYLLKHLVRVVRKDETLHLDKNDNILVFSGSDDAGLLYSVSVNPIHLETLHLNVTPKQGFENFWTQDELRVLKQFFEVVVTPCKLNILTAFARLLGANPRVLKDAIRIMRIEMTPDPNQIWYIEWSFMTPPAIVASIAAPGTPAVVLKAKNLFYFQLTDARDSNRRFVFSILYDTNKNIVQPTEFPHSPGLPQEPPSWAKSAREACNVYLKEIADSIPDQECRLFPTLLTLVNNFVYR